MLKHTCTWILISAYAYRAYRSLYNSNVDNAQYPMGIDGDWTSMSFWYSENYWYHPLNRTANHFFDSGQVNAHQSVYNAPVALRPAVLRFIPEPPGSSRFMDRDEPGENDGFFAVEALKTREHPGAPRGTPVHPGRSPVGPRLIPALTRFAPVLGPVLHGSPRSMPAEPRWLYGFSRFSTAELRSFPVHYGSSRRGENEV